MEEHSGIRTLNKDRFNARRTQDYRRFRNDKFDKFGPEGHFGENDRVPKRIFLIEQRVLARIILHCTKQRFAGRGIRTYPKPQAGHSTRCQ